MVTCCYFNAQCIDNKISDLHDILYHAVPDCLVTESWLHADFVMVYLALV